MSDGYNSNGYNNNNRGGGGGYNRGNYQPRPQNPNSPAMNRPMFQPKEMFDGDGVIVRLKNMHIPKQRGNFATNPIVNISWANKPLLENEYGLIGIEGKPAFLNSLIKLILGVSDNKEVKRLREYELTIQMWNEQFAEKVVLVRMADMQIKDRDTGENKTVQVLEAVNPPQGYSTPPQAQPQAQPDPVTQAAINLGGSVRQEPQADAHKIIEQKTAQEWFADLLTQPEWAKLAELYMPAVGAPDVQYKLAKVKLAGAMKPILDEWNSTLNAVKPEVEKYILPMKLDEAVKLTKSKDISDFMNTCGEMTIADIRAVLGQAAQEQVPF